MNERARSTMKELIFYTDCELSEKWRVPVEEDADIQQAIKLYAPTEGN